MTEPVPDWVSNVILPDGETSSEWYGVIISNSSYTFELTWKDVHRKAHTEWLKKALDKGSHTS